MREKSNIEALIACNPDLIGFIFYPPSSRFVGWDFVVDEAINATKVGVFVNESLEKVSYTASHAKLDFIQLHGEESVEYCEKLFLDNHKIIKAFSIDNDFDFNLTAPYSVFCEFFLFDTATISKGGSGLQFDWQILKKYLQSKKFFLSGGIGPEDAERILQLQHPALAGIDINSRFEKTPGIKDIEQIKSFIHAIRNNKSF